MKLDYLWRGLPGHPLHPPLTDAVIGAYTVSAVLGILGALGVAESNMAKGWWLALIVGLVASVPTALTGVADWVTITRSTPLWRTATLHWAAILAATLLFAVAAILGHEPYADGEVSASALTFTLVGYAVLTVGGWLGGTVVYVHGMRVLELTDEPTTRAAAPAPMPEKELAEGE